MGSTPNNVEFYDGIVKANPIVIYGSDGKIISSFGGGTQYTDGAAAPAHPIGGEIVYNKAGTMTAVSDTNPLPSSVPVDTFGTATPLTAATTFTGVPTISQLAGSSFVLLANPGNQATFLAEIAIASAFVGTLSFYGLEPDAATLQLISAHQRSTTTITTSTAINTGVALNQVWMGSIADFKAVYVVCTTFTSGSASVQLGLTAATYGVAILNTANVSVTNANANGQTTMSASAPVVIASDQTPVQVKRSTVAVYSLASTTSTGATQNSGDLTVGPYTEISLDINTTAQAGTSPTLQLFYERKAADGIYYVLWQSAVLTVAANTLSTSIGAGMAYNQSLGVTGRLRWVVGGSATPTYTFSASIQGK